MKKYIFTFIVLALCSCNESKETKQEKDKNLLSADLVNNPSSANGIDTAAMSELPVMDFTDTVFNFGAVKEGEVVVHEFEFKNTGKTPLIIGSANASCGCTVPDYPHEPIPPGGTGNLIVKFNSDGKPGHQEKSVTIQTNTQQAIHHLHIKADVSKK